MSKNKKEEVYNQLVTKKQFHSIDSARHIDVYRDENKNLKNISIEGKTIDNYTFARLDLEGSKFKDSIFTKCKFQGVDFARFDVENCSFNLCEMKFAVFPEDFWSKNKNNNCSIR